MVIIKSIKTKLYSKLELKFFIEAYERASMKKGLKEEILLFEIELESNIINLIESIRNNTYFLGDYKEFTIYEPKERIIRKLPFIDRIVHQWYIEEFIKDYYKKVFIYDSYACIEGKGSHKAVYRLQNFMRIMKNKYNDYYIIKCDIKKYFDNIDKDILYRILTSKIKDNKLKLFTHKMIYENNNFNGICIGNYTSQWFANIYLNELDYYIKYELKIKYYLRYLDDFICLVKDKNKAKEIYNLIEKYVNSKLHLELNSKSKYYPNKLGCDFCGYIVYENYIKIRKRSKKKINKSIRLWNYLYINNKFNKHEFILSYNSYIGHIKHADSYNYIKSINSKILFIRYRIKNILIR